MDCSIGDAVKFKLKSGEINEGDVVFIERSLRENIVYINSSDRRAYKIPEKRIISLVPENLKRLQENVNLRPDKQDRQDTSQSCISCKSCQKS